MFLQSRLQSPFGLSDVDLAAAAGDTIYHIGLFTRRQCILHFGQHRMESPPGLKDYSDVKLPAGCDFVIRTNKELYIERIYRNDTWWQKQLLKLKTFYFQALLPELACTRYYSGGIREPIPTK